MWHICIIFIGKLFGWTFKTICRSRGSAKELYIHFKPLKTLYWMCKNLKSMRSTSAFVVIDTHFYGLSLKQFACHLFTHQSDYLISIKTKLKGFPLTKIHSLI